MSIRHCFPLLALAALSTTATAQATGAPPKAKPAMKHEASHENSAWKEMSAFHAILAATFHPVSESNNLKPLRERAADLSAAGRTWAASTAPKPCATETLRESVGTISSEALAIANHVLASAADADLKKAITALHDRFEAVEKACNPGGMKH